MSYAAVMGLALAIDVVFGWPAWLYARIGHPVTWIGALITALSLRANRGGVYRRRALGVLCTLIVVFAAILPALAVQLALSEDVWGLVIAAILAWPLIAARSLYAHVAAVARCLSAGDLPGARAAIAMIVGRDPEQLDRPGIIRAALESLSENSSDGIVAPLFWGVIFGLPGIVAYKAVNTLDSMIGYRNERYGEFGKFAARLDDFMNLLPARLTGLAIILVSGRVAALRVMWRDARTHRSPNAGWPEAAMAGALGVRLSGPRVYDGHVADEPWLNMHAPDPGVADLARALVLYVRVMIVCGAILILLALI